MVALLCYLPARMKSQDAPTTTLNEAETDRLTCNFPVHRTTSLMACVKIEETVEYELFQPDHTGASYVYRATSV